MTKNYQNNCEEEVEFNDYAPAGEMHPMYQVTRVSWIIASAATCAQRKEINRRQTHSQRPHIRGTLELSTPHRRTPS